MGLLKMNASKEFDYETFLDENPVPVTIDKIFKRKVIIISHTQKVDLSLFWIY